MQRPSPPRVLRTSFPACAAPLSSSLIGGGCLPLGMVAVAGPGGLGILEVLGASEHSVRQGDVDWVRPQARRSPALGELAQERQTLGAPPSCLNSPISLPWRSCSSAAVSLSWPLGSGSGHRSSKGRPCCQTQRAIAWAFGPLRSGRGMTARSAVHRKCSCTFALSLPQSPGHCISVAGLANSSLVGCSLAVTRQSPSP